MPFRVFEKQKKLWNAAICRMTFGREAGEKTYPWSK